MAIDDVYELTVTTNVDQELCNQVFHYKQLASNGPLDPIAALKNTWVTTMLPLFRAPLSNQAAVETLRIRKIAPSVGGSALFLIDEEGDINDEALPPNSAVIVALYSDTYTKHGRGRSHFPGYPETKHSDGIIDASQLVYYQDLGVGLVNDLPAIGQEPGFRAGIYNSQNGNFASFTAFIVRPQLYTLRSRRMATKLT